MINGTGQLFFSNRPITRGYCHIFCTREKKWKVKKWKLESEISVRNIVYFVRLAETKTWNLAMICTLVNLDGWSVLIPKRHLRCDSWSTIPMNMTIKKRLFEYSTMKLYMYFQPASPKRQLIFYKLKKTQ